jgi:hypothetical protein
MDLDLITNNSRIVGEENGQLITTDEREEKDLRRIKLICDGCGKIFEVNVLFDKNGVSVGPLLFSRYCSKCILEVRKKEEDKK